MKKYYLKLNLVGLVIFLSFHLSMAEELSPVDQEALGKTEELLQNNSERNKLISKDPDAKKADAMANNLKAQGVDKEQLYKLAASIFRNLAHTAQGDGDKMLENVSQAQSNPEAFYNSLSPEQKKSIEDMVKTIQLNNPEAKP